MLLLAVTVFGLIIGSFLSVCIYRIPYGRPMGPPDWEAEAAAAQQAASAEPAAACSSAATASSELPPAEAPSTVETEQLSLFYPKRSFCPSCRKQLTWYHNIPLFSWLALGGKCGFCKARIPFRYPLVELLSATAAAMSLLSFGLSWTAILVFAFCAMLIVISFIDIDYYIIPDVISIPGTVLGVFVGLLNEFTGVLRWPVVPGIVDSLLGVAFGGGVLFLIAEGYYRLRKREGLGLGDVKLLALTGAFFGLPGALYTMFIGSLLGSVLGILMILLSGKRMTYQLPFGPYLALGTVFYLFVSPWTPPWQGLQFLAW